MKTTQVQRFLRKSILAILAMAELAVGSNAQANCLRDEAFKDIKSLRRALAEDQGRRVVVSHDRRYEGNHGEAYQEALNKL